MKLCAISVDLDEIPNYFKIHGLTAPEKSQTAVYDIAVARLVGLASAEKIPLTLFAVGDDLKREESARALSDAHKAGHEIANHTWTHSLSTVFVAPRRLARELERANDLIEQTTGTRPTWFRPPAGLLAVAVMAVADTAKFTVERLNRRIF